MTNKRSTPRAVRLAILAGLVAVILGASLPALTAGDTPTGPPQVHTVEAGETLWSLSKQVAPDEDPRATVNEIRRLNGLESPQIYPGQRLVLPPH